MSIELLSEKDVTARKTHLCRTCDQPAAEPGDRYHRATYVYDGRVYDWVQCAPCREMGREVTYWSIDADEFGVGQEDYAEWAAEHVIHGTPDQQAMAKAYLERLGGGES